MAEENLNPPEQRWASELSGEPADHYRSLVNAINAAVVSTDGTGKIFLWNAGAERMFGYPAAEAVGGRLSVLLGSPSVEQELASTAGPDQAGTFEVALRRRDGSVFAAEVSILALGMPGTSAIIRDISHQCPYEDALRRYELLARNSRDIILFMRRADGHILDANSAAFAVYGYSREELTGMSIRDLRAPDTSDLTAAQMEEADRAGILFETRHRRRDDSIFPVEVSSQGAIIGGVRTLISVVRDISERKRAEDESREAFEQRRLALEAAEMGAWDYRLETGQVFWDERCRSMWGIPSGQRIHYDAAVDRIHPEDREHVRTAVNSAIAGVSDGVYHQQFRVIWPDGTMRWVSSHGRVLFEGAGADRRAVRFIGANRDITLRKEVEAAALESRRQRDFLAEIVELTSQPFGVGYPDGRLGIFNRAFERLTGYNAEELRSIDWQVALTPPKWRDTERGKLEELQRTGRTVSYEKEYTRKDGSRVPIEMLVGAARDPQGAIQYYYAFITDITRRKQAEATTQRSLHRLELLARTATELLQTSDPRRIVSSLCSRVMEHLGCDMFFNYLMDEEDGRLHLNACSGMAGVEKRLKEIDFRTALCACAREARRFIPEHMASSTDPCMGVVASLGIKAFACHPLLGPEGKVMGTLAFGTCDRETFDEEEVLLMGAVCDRVATALVRMRDEQALRASERELARANEDLERRVAERTEMLERTIHALQREIEERQRTAAELTLANRQMEERARQLQHLAGELTLAEHRERHRIGKFLHDHLQQLLSSAKMQMSCLSPERDVSMELACRKIEELLGEAMQVTRSLAGELSPPILQVGLKAGLQWLAHRVAERFRLDVAIEAQDDPHMPEDLKILLFEAVRELLFNCAKHSGAHRAAVGILREEAGVCVTVSDNGTGFDPQKLSNPGEMGTGFGLFSIRERLQLVGGAFEIESSSPDGGSRFRLRVPIPHAGPSLGAPASDSSSRRIRVLLVDDHAIMRDGLAVMLSKESDIEVVGEAQDGWQALETARRLVPDVILMDISMPGLNGIEATRILHAELPGVRVIGLSMLYEEGERAEAIRSAGAVGYVSKSAPSNQLLAALRGCMSTEVPPINRGQG